MGKGSCRIHQDRSRLHSMYCHAPVQTDVSGFYGYITITDASTIKIQGRPETVTQAQFVVSLEVERAKALVFSAFTFSGDLILGICEKRWV